MPTPSDGAGLGRCAPSNGAGSGLRGGSSNSKIRFVAEHGALLAFSALWRLLRCFRGFCMNASASSFLSRVHLFFAGLKGDEFPNATTLAEAAGCSRNTAQRTIYRMRDEYLVPLDYDAGRKGYFLKDRKYELPQLLPAGKDELSALLLARDLVRSFDAKDVATAIDKLWHQISLNSQLVSVELEPLMGVFSSRGTAVGRLADVGILQYIFAAARGDNVAVKYRSPWRGNVAKEYVGRVLHVHFSNLTLYLKFWDGAGREIILNASFIEEFRVLDKDVELKPVKVAAEDAPEDWLEGFGVWSGEKVVATEIRIAAPASFYFAKELWHEDQVDTFEGEVLVRKMPAIVSPELVRRVLSIGKYVVGIEPKELRDAVREEVIELGKSL